MRLLGVALAVAIAGCGNGGVEPSVPPCDAAKAIRSTPSFLTVAEESDIAARVLPGGFGGLFRKYGAASHDLLVAYFTNLTIAGAHKKDLRDVLLCAGIYPGWAGELVPVDVGAMSFWQGQYTGTELLNYLRALEPLRSDPGVWGLEVDPETNRIWIGLTDASQVGRIQQQVSARAVPVAAVQLETPPPTTGSEPFEILNAPVQVEALGGVGVLGFSLHVRFTNRQSATRYPDWCVGLDTGHNIKYFAYELQKWNGVNWNRVMNTICAAILLPPRSIDPGQVATDTVPVVAVRRLNSEPVWQTARTTGTYRFVAYVYRAVSPGPGGTQFVTDLAPLEERVSVPFRVTSTLSF